MEIKIKSLSGRLPEYKTSGAAGMDISAYTDHKIVIKPGCRAIVPTGLFMEIEEGWEVQVRARSGLAAKNGIGLVNGIGTIDSDYRGEIKVILMNWGDEPFEISDGDRIAQIVPAKVERIDLLSEDELEETLRGDGGFGHTGV